MPGITSRRTSGARRAAGLLAVAAAATVTLSACGSVDGPAGANPNQSASAIDQNPDATLPPSTPATDEASSPAATTAAATPSESESASASGTAASTSANTPAVAGATDLAKEPVIAAGTGAPSPQLVVKDLVVGTGTAATTADTVDVRYVGTIYTSGKVFDASWTRTPTDTTFPLSEVVPGFAQGIAGMKPGGRREIVIPAALGYGPEGGQPSAGISATDTIVFVVDYLKLGAS